MRFILAKVIFGSLKLMAGLFIVLGFSFNVAALAQNNAQKHPEIGNPAESVETVSVAEDVLLPAVSEKHR